jgi:hypothetical protein
MMKARDKIKMVSVICKCPYCGILHGVSMSRVRPGFIPRIVCEGYKCRASRDVAYSEADYAY